MSKSREILTRVLEIVAHETDIPAGRIMSRCSDMETVDARWICVKLLKTRGYYPSRIAELMHITPRYVQYILSDFEDRLSVSGMIRINYEHCAKRLRRDNEISTY
ncbi:MAG: helix-turn-helix domain-containing protein [Muribaculaceae bacterium]|nr:helix-turn-helix domain-containing protein [Muribaculaceae bacterium]